MEDLKNVLGLEYRDTLTYAQKVSRYGLSKMPPLIITCSITGGNQGAEVNPALPETLEDQVQSTYDAYNAGAAMVHIHRRDPKNLGYATQNWEDYLEVNRAVRDKCPDIIVNNTCVGSRLLNFKDRTISEPMLVSIPAKPEVGSIDLVCAEGIGIRKARKAPLTGRDQDMEVRTSIFMNQDDCINCAKLMMENGTKPEWECFDIGNLAVLNRMIAMGMAAEPQWVSMIFGGTGILPSIESMQLVEKFLPKSALLNVIGVGPCQTAMITLAILMGHHVRVGMEDSYYYDAGVLAKSNAQLVERVVRIARELGRPVATPAQAREMMGLGAPRQY